MERAIGALVADDEPHLLRLFAIVLRQAGMPVWTDGCGHEAVELLRQQGAGSYVALLDVRMPGLSGPEAPARMREPKLGLPCVFMTGDAGLCGEKELAMAQRVLYKPFAVDEAVRAVREAAALCSPSLP